MLLRQYRDVVKGRDDHWASLLSVRVENCNANQQTRRALDLFIVLKPCTFEGFGEGLNL